MSRKLKLLLILPLYVAGIQAENAGSGAFSAEVAGGTLTVGHDCSESSPCNVRFGNTVHSIKTPATIRSTGNTSGLVLIYIDRSGELIAGSRATLTCGHCIYRANVSQFPPDSVPLYTWTVVGGVLDANSKTDLRAPLSTKAIVAGNAIEISESAGTATIAVDSTMIATRALDPPKSSQAPCTAGQFSFDASYYYVCVATNKWKRVALQDF